MTLRDDLAVLTARSHATTWKTFDWVRSHAKLYSLSPAKTAGWKIPGEPAFVSNPLEYRPTSTWSELKPRALAQSIPLPPDQGTSLVGAFCVQPERILNVSRIQRRRIGGRRLRTTGGVDCKSQHSDYRPAMRDRSRSTRHNDFHLVRVSDGPPMKRTQSHWPDVLA